MKQFINHTFESNSSITNEFKSFARAFRSEIKKQISDGMILDSFSIGHFYISGFIKKDERFVYFSCSDVRYFPNDWFNRILIRTAENNKDFTGGMNNYTSLEDFGKKVKNLLNKRKEVNYVL